MSFSLPLVAALVLQQVSVLSLPRESSPDLQHIIADESALSFVEVWYSVAEQPGYIPHQRRRIRAIDEAKRLASSDLQRQSRSGRCATIACNDAGCAVL